MGIRNLDFQSFLRLRPGGLSDNVALTGLAASAILNSPAFVGSLNGLLPHGAVVHPALQSFVANAPGLAGLGVGLAGGAWFGQRVANVLKSKVFESRLDFTSSPVPSLDGRPLSMEEGMTIGYCIDSGQRVTIPWEDWMRHGGILGASGVGKTVLGEWLMAQQIAAGGGLIWVNGKLDPDGLVFLRNACAWAGREHDLMVINPGDPDNSNTYNPILYGDADEVADRLLSLLPASENSPGSDHYRQSAKQALTTLIKAIQRTGRAYNFMDLNILLQNVKAMEWLENLVPNGDEKKALQLFLDQYKAPDRQGKVGLDVKRMKETFGGIGGRLHTFGTGNFGKITSDYDPEVNLFDAVRNNKIVYVMLPTMGKKEAASNFGKMVIGDYRTTVSWIQDLPKPERPWPPFLSFFDEAGSYVTPAFSTMFEQSRSAHMVLLPAVQTLANYEAISAELREMVIGNNWTKIFFKIGTPESSNMAADMIGKFRRVVYGISASSGSGASKAPSPTRHTTGMNNTASIGYNEGEEEAYKVSPDDLSQLDKGECIVVYGGRDVYHVKVPRLSFDAKDPRFVHSARDVHLNRFRKDFVQGLDLFRDADRWLTGGKYD